MTGLLILAALVTSAAYLAAEMALAGDDNLADLGTTHDPDCGACAVADDPTLTSFDITLWAMECEGIG